MHVVNGRNLAETMRSTIAFNLNAWRLTSRAQRTAARTTQAEFAELVETFNARKIVLTITAGRTGTDSVSRLFDFLPGANAQHEPNPNHRFILNRIQSRPKEAAHFFWHLQAPALVDRAHPSTVESSHLFCKGFFEPCIAAGFRPSLILLTRDTRKTAISHQRKNGVPGRTGASFRYHVAPSDDVYLPVADSESLTDYQMCYWYCLEIELRQKLYSEIANELGLPVTTIDTAQLSNMDELVRVATDLGLADANAARNALGEAGVGRAFNAAKNPPIAMHNFDPDAEEAALRQRLGAPATIADVYRRIERARSFL